MKPLLLSLLALAQVVCASTAFAANISLNENVVWNSVGKSLSHYIHAEIGCNAEMSSCRFIRFANLNGENPYKMVGFDDITINPRSGDILDQKHNVIGRAFVFAPDYLDSGYRFDGLNMDEVNHVISINPDGVNILNPVVLTEGVVWNSVNHGFRDQVHVSIACDLPNDSCTFTKFWSGYEDDAETAVSGDDYRVAKLKQLKLDLATGVITLNGLRVGKSRQLMIESYSIIHDGFEFDNITIDEDRREITIW